MSERSWYETAQICGNGHVVTAMVESSPERLQEFCEQCGTATITKCPKCEKNIRGYYFVPGVIGCTEYRPPAFCGDCGALFPWTAGRLEAAREMADELEDLKPAEREALKRNLEDLVRETPRTEIAVLQVKKTLRKVGPASVELAKRMVTEIATDAAKKLLGLP